MSLSLRQISLENFRLFEKLDFPFAPLTVLTGPNSSGKSSIVKALLLLQDNLQKYQLGQLDFTNADHQLGSFDSVKTKGTTDSAPIAFELGYDGVNFNSKDNKDISDLSGRVFKTFFEYAKETNEKNGELINFSLGYLNKDDNFVEIVNAKSSDGTFKVSIATSILTMHIYQKGDIDFLLDYSQTEVSIISPLKEELSKLENYFEQEFKDKIADLEKNYSIKVETITMNCNTQIMQSVNIVNYQKQIEEIEASFVANVQPKIDGIDNEISILENNMQIKSQDFEQNIYEKTNERETVIDTICKYIDTNAIPEIKNRFDPKTKFSKEYISENILTSETKNIVEELYDKIISLDSEIDSLNEEMILYSNEMQQNSNAYLIERDNLNTDRDNKINNINSFIAKEKSAFEIKRDEQIRDLKDNLDNDIAGLTFEKYFMDIAQIIQNSCYSNLTNLAISEHSNYDLMKFLFSHNLIGLIMSKIDAFIETPIEDLLEGHAQFVFLKGSVFGKMTLKRLLNQDIFENLATKINDEIHAFLNIFFKPLPFVHIKGIRGAQQRFYNSNGTSDLDKSINLLLTLQNQKDKEKLDFIHEWLPKFGINGIIEAQQIDGSYITATIDGRYIADLGLGISQLLPIIITTAYHLGDGYLIAIEEPESHLHPKLQSVLADFMVAAIGKGARFLVETHSVYFIRKIEVLLANKQLSSDNLRVCYIKKNEDIGASTPEVIDIEANEDGLNEQQTSGLWRDFYDEAERLTQEKKIIKHIKEGMKVFFVEKNDVKHYNKLKLSNIFFYEANDKNDVFRISKQDNVSFYGLMDRDLLHDDEIEKIREEFPRLFILPFYNIESLLFHPENLKEALGDSFDICQYKDEILKQFTEYRVKGITRNIDASRGSYLILKEHIIYKNDTKKVKKIADKICEEIFKDDFASFYKYYNLRDNFNKGFIEKKLPKRDDLSSTQWFKKQIEEVLSPLLSQTKDESDTIG